jgi:hypothetical protein
MAQPVSPVGRRFADLSTSGQGISQGNRLPVARLPSIVVATRVHSQQVRTKTQPRLAGLLALSLQPWRQAPARVIFAPVLRMRPLVVIHDELMDAEIDRLLMQIDQPAGKQQADAEVSAVLQAQLAAMRESLRRLLAIKNNAAELRHPVINAINTGTAAPMPVFMAAAMRVLADGQAAGHPASGALQMELVRIADQANDDGRLTLLFALHCTAGAGAAENDSSKQALFLLRTSLSRLGTESVNQVLINAARLDWWRTPHGMTSDNRRPVTPPVLRHALVRLVALMEGPLPLCPSKLKPSFLEHLMASLCRHRQAYDADEVWDDFIDRWTDQATALDDERFAKLLLALYWTLRFMQDKSLSLRVLRQILMSVEHWCKRTIDDVWPRRGGQCPIPRASFNGAEAFVDIITEHLQKCLEGSIETRLYVSLCACTLERILAPLQSHWANTVRSALRLLEKEADKPCQRLHDDPEPDLGMIGTCTQS